MRREINNVLRFGLIGLIWGLQACSASYRRSIIVDEPRPTPQAGPEKGASEQTKSEAELKAPHLKLKLRAPGLSKALPDTELRYSASLEGLTREDLVAFENDRALITLRNLTQATKGLLRLNILRDKEVLYQGQIEISFAGGESELIKDLTLTAVKSPEAGEKINPKPTPVTGESQEASDVNLDLRIRFR